MGFESFVPEIMPGNATMSGILGLFWLMYLGVGAFTSIFALAVYIIQSLSITKMLKSVGHKHPWFAWIPVLNNRAIGDLADCYDNGKPSKHLGKKLFTIAVVEIILAFVTVCTAVIPAIIVMFGYQAYLALLLCVVIIAEALAMLVLIIPYYVYMYDSTWRIYRIFAPSASVLLLLLTVFFGDIRAFIFLFISRKAPQNLRAPEITCECEAECAPEA